MRSVDEMVRAVAATYGPRGRTVMLDRAGGLLTTKDGATVAWEIEPADLVGRLATRAVQEACSRVSKVCGDGTTTTAILIGGILRESLQWVAGGMHPAVLATELQQVGAQILNCELLALHLEPLEEEALLFEVSRSASNGDEEVAHAIAEALGRVGSEGMILVEEGKGRGVEVTHKRGMDLPRGWESSDFASEGGGPRQLDAALVVLYDGTMTKMDQIAPLLEEATQFPHPLVLVSRGCYGEALQLLVANDRKLTRADGQPFEVVAVRAPGHYEFMRDQLEDLAALTGAQLFDPRVFSPQEFSPDQFGSAQSIVIKSSSTTFTAFPDKYPLIEIRVEQLRRREEVTSSSYDREEIKTRVAKLTDGLCLMKVGGWSMVEIRERRGRVEDALGAVRAAVERGIVPGGGIAFLAASRAMEPATPAEKILARALEEPFRWLARNAGYSPRVILGRVLKACEESGIPGWDTGWDAMTDEVRDFKLSPVLCDPYEVVREAFEVAVSTAAMLLSAEVALTKVKQ